MHQIKMNDGVHILDDSKGWWVLKKGAEEERIVRAAIVDKEAIKAFAEAVLYALSRGHGPAAAPTQITEWTGLAKEISVLIRADRVGEAWFLVVNLEPMEIIYCYLVGPDGCPSPLGHFDGKPKDEESRLKVGDFLEEARTMMI